MRPQFDAENLQPKHVAFSTPINLFIHTARARFIQRCPAKSKVMVTVTCMSDSLVI